MIVLISGAAWLSRGRPVAPVDEIPEIWTTYTAASDGIVSECLCQMAMATDGSIWVVGWDGIFVAPEKLTVLATASNGSTWMAMGDSIVGVDGALIEYAGERYTAYDLGGVRDAVFEEDGTGWFLVPQVGADAWMFGREQWSEPGLYRLDRGDWYRITVDDGLAGYRISAMLHAPDGALWRTGIMR